MKNADVANSFFFLIKNVSHDMSTQILIIKKYKLKKKKKKKNLGQITNYTPLNLVKIQLSP